MSAQLDIPEPAEKIAAPVQIEDRWYVLVPSAVADERVRVLKHGETFALFNQCGNIRSAGLGELGLYHEGTRFLSNMELTLNGLDPMLLNSTIKEDNSLLTVDLTTPDLYMNSHLAIPKGTLYISRSKLIWEGVHYEHIRIVNYGEREISFEIELKFAADYVDIFEVRGIRREERGVFLPPQKREQELLLSYSGLDGVIRRTHINFSKIPQVITENKAIFPLELERRGKTDLFLTVSCEVDDKPIKILPYQEAYGQCAGSLAAMRESAAQVDTSNEIFNDWLRRAGADLNMLVTQTPLGAYPYAGVPWYSTPFGRDGIITALQCLWFDPDLARGVLAFLAENQAVDEIPAQDAEPGKIFHEMRQGEMAALGEVPFQLYYGSIDATPLFIVLAEAYYQRTGNIAFIQGLWPHIQRALGWIDHYGDLDGDGFVEYMRHGPLGLVHQGWKDSEGAVFHQDGTPAEGPIAVCEVQGYVYAAKCGASRIARVMGDMALSRELERQAEQLKQQFNRIFWCSDLETYALALDGRKRLCRVRSSNAGHTLFSGIAYPDYARRLVRTLMAEASFSGWGIRTIAQTEIRYNPMSYHNGTVWPHDNSLIGMGLARYGFQEEAMKVMTGMFEASATLELHRLPELFCGFRRLSGQGPTLYPVACSPQAWASGTPFYLLQACLGLTFSSEKPQIHFFHPRLPQYLQGLEIKNLKIDDGVIDLAFCCHPHDVGINVLRREGDIEIAVRV